MGHHGCVNGCGLLKVDTLKAIKILIPKERIIPRDASSGFNTLRQLFDIVYIIKVM